MSNSAKNPPPPQIFNECFKRNCLQYEYLKTAGCPRKTFKNLCEALISEEIRDDVATRSIPRLLEEDSQESESSEGPSPAIRKITVKPDRPSTSSTIPESSESSESSEESEEDLHPGQKRIPDPEDFISPNFGLLYDDEWKDVPLEITTIQLLKTDEENINIDTIPYEIEIIDKETAHEFGSIRKIFDRYGDEYLGFEEWPFFKKVPVWLGELRQTAFSLIWLHLFDKEDVKLATHPFNELEVVIDYGKIKIDLSHSITSEMTKFEYWEGEDGCWIWHEDDVKFIETFPFDTLAANEFIGIINNTKHSFDFLGFDYAKPMPWSPKDYHSPNFALKIRRWKSEIENKLKIKTGTFVSKIYKSRWFPVVKLDYLDEKVIETIGIRVWDDSHFVTNESSREEMEEQLRLLTFTNQWKMAKCLDIADPYFGTTLLNIDNFKES